MKYIKDSHCSWCGTAFQVSELEKICERLCNGCNKPTYYNPPPVSVSLIKVTMEKSSQAGILLVKRTDHPECPWALPGGYLNRGEPWKHGAARELMEEAGLTISPEDIELLDVKDAITTHSLLIFNTSQKIFLYSNLKFVPNREISEIDICYSPRELTFPTHTMALKEYLDKS